MDPYSSGEDLVVKTRKPYTITKQRERWTEEEHNRFLDALKLYGRAWQRIEEHIGTKTAVQIRSHAQKFFTKLQKEANIKGVPIAHAVDIEIPPPRPKRKPSNPYPRKTSAGAAVTPQAGAKNGNIPSSISSSCQSKVTVDLEKEPEEPSEYQGKTAPCSSPSRSPDDASAHNHKTSTFIQYVPLSKEASDDQDETAASQITVEAKGTQSDFQDNPPSNVMNSYLPHEKSVHSKRLDEQNQPGNLDKLSSSDALLQASQNYPRNVPVQILDGSLGTSGPQAAADCSSASRPWVHHLFSSYHPALSQIQNQDDYQSLLQISSMFSSLIVSVLSQNPASFAAARCCASLWPSGVNRESTPSSPQATPTTPTMAAMAAATVAAATAWWAANGLIPCASPPFHPVPPETNNVERSDQDQEKGSEALHEEPQISALKSSPVLLSSESEASGDAKLVSDCTPEKEVADTLKTDDANKSKNKVVADHRSSCGSNTNSGSGSEVDAYASEKVVTEGQDEKHAKEDEEVLEEGQDFSRRCRSTTNMNDSWKEVSEEGRLAFRALFSRQRLPQSFSPPHDKGKRIPIKESGDEKDENGLRLELDLNGKPWVVNVTNPQQPDNNVCETYDQGPLLNMGLGHFKPKARRTGFKPYKRCSIEAKETRDEENEPKRLRMEGKASA